MIQKLDYADGKIMGAIMKKINELNLRYYVDGEGVVRTYWSGEWYKWHEVMLRDVRMKV